MKLNNGIDIPQIGVGTWTLRGETARQNVHQALEAGFRHIDTAQGYENETEVGQGIADSGVAPSLMPVTVPTDAPPLLIMTRADHPNVAAGLVALFME